MSQIQVSVENISHLARRLSVTVPVEQLEQNTRQQFVELSKKACLDGFRPGKVPISVIKKIYGNSVWHDMIEKSLQTSLAAALQQEALNPAGQPHIDSIKAEPGNDLEYVVSFEIYPPVQVPELKGESVERLQVDITEVDVDKVLEQMRRQQLEWSEVSRKAHYGDQVTFDLIPLEGEGKPRSNLRWVLEEGKVPKGFTPLLSSAAGEVFSTSLPKEEGLDELISARLEVKKVAEAKLPDLDDAFAQRLGIQKGTVEALRCEVQQHMQAELDQVLREKLKTQVIDKLLAMHTIHELPQVLLDQEFQRLEQEFHRRRERQEGKEGKALSLSEDEKVALTLTARRRVILGLLFNALIEKYQLQIDEARVHQQIERFANAFQFDHVVRDKFYKDKNMMMNIRSSTLEEQVIDKLLEEVEYTQKIVKYADMMDLTLKRPVTDTDKVEVIA